MTSSQHNAKPSYFGDQLRYEFPSSSEESLISEKEHSPVIIERAGSIFIKSGIPKVSPFPTIEDENKVEEVLSKKYGTQSTTSLPIEEKLDELEDIAEIEIGEETENVKEKGEEKVEDIETSIESRKRANSEESHYNDSLYEDKSITEASLIRKRPSLKAVNSISSSKFVNPYLRRSVLRKYKGEVEKDDVLGKFVEQLEKEVEPSNINNTINDTTINTMNTDDLEIPRRSSKRVSQMIKRNPSKNISRMNTIRSHNSANTISRRTSKRDADRVKRSLSIQTLASDVRKSIQGRSFKSVDFGALDKLLEELLDVQTSSSESSERSLSLKSVRKRSISCHSTRSGNSNRVNSAHNLNREATDNDDVFVANAYTPLIKPFSATENGSGNVKRVVSLKRSLSSMQKSLQPETMIYNKELPKIVEEDKCELKRSNAVKYKNRFIESIILLLDTIKRFGKRVINNFKVSSKKVVGIKRGKSVMKRSKSVKDLKIGQPVPVDIHQTAFKTHNLNTETVSRKTFSVGGSSSDNTNERILLNSKHLSTIESINEDTNETNGSSNVENDQIVLLWKHYLSTCIANRVDMKLELVNANNLERVKSIQSNSSKLSSVNEKQEIERLMDKYVASENSSRSDTIKKGDGDINSKSFDWFASFESLNSSELLSEKSFDHNDDNNSSSDSEWSTIMTDGINNLDYEDSSSISTIEEEHEADILTDEEYDNGLMNLGDEIKKNSATTNDISKSTQSNIKNSVGMLNLQGVLKNVSLSSKPSKSTLAKKKSVVISDIKSMNSKYNKEVRTASPSTLSSSRSSSMSDMFSFQASVVV